MWFSCASNLRPDGYAGYTVLDRLRPASLTTAELHTAGQTVRLSVDIEEGGLVSALAVERHDIVIARAMPITVTSTDFPLT